MGTGVSVCGGGDQGRGRAGFQKLPPQEWEILARIQQLQRSCRSYCLSPHPPILAALRAQRQLSEEQR